MATIYRIFPVRTPEDLKATLSLLAAYVTWLDLDLTFQDYTTELASMPGKYAPPDGELLLARSSTTQEPIGCIAFRPLNKAGCCEMIRLWVTPEGRGTGVGKALILEALKVAKERGYKECKLDTLPRMVGARRLYENVGFEVVEKYYDTPVEETVFLGKML